MSRSSSSLEREIDEYQDVSSGSGGSYESGEGSTSVVVAVPQTSIIRLGFLVFL